MFVAKLTRALVPFGLSLIGVATAAAYDTVVPSSHRLGASTAPAGAIVVIGNGGGAFWSAYRD